MKAKTFTTTFGGVKRTNCIIIIEEIKVTDPKDINNNPFKTYNYGNNKENKVE
jgi:hypothetical protein